MENIAVLVLSCAQPRYAEERLRIWESLKSLAEKCHIFYLFGKSELHTIIPEHPNVFKIIADCGDHYEDIPRKMWYGYNIIYNLGYDAVIKVDENVEITDTGLFNMTARSELRLHDYVALRCIGHRQFPARDDTSAVVSYYHFGKVHDKRLNYIPVVLPLCHYAGGPCYALSRRALSLLCLDDFERCLYEDYAVGSALSSRNINLYPSKLIDTNMFAEKNGDIGAIPPSHISVKDLLRVLYSPPPHIVPHTVFVSVTGGLGNQLFQIATGLCYAYKNNLRLALVQDSANIRGYYWDNILCGLSKVVVEKCNCTNMYNEPSFAFSKLPNTDKDIYLKGYFQSEKYFHSISSLISSVLRLPDLRDYFVLKYGSDILSETAVIVHARRGDYLESQHKINFHGPLANIYYEKARDAIKTTLSNPLFVLISDDSEFWNANPVFLNENAIVVNEPDSFILYLMTQCRNFIISNSTFSWWGTFLAKSKNVIAPAAWFGPTGPQDYKDVYLENWKCV